VPTKGYKHHSLGSVYGSLFDYHLANNFNTNSMEIKKHPYEPLYFVIFKDTKDKATSEVFKTRKEAQDFINKNK
jgi:hypothetical protein